MHRRCFIALLGGAIALSCVAACQRFTYGLTTARA
jgi:hypothetical protein